MATETFQERMSGAGHVLPHDGAGLHAYFSKNSKGKFGLSREDFVTQVRTLIDNGKLNDLERQRLVALGWPELDS